MAGHRYWRIRCLTGGNPIAAGEIQFRTVAGGAMAYTGVGIASSYYGGGYEIAYAFDGDPATPWAAAGGAGEWIGYDFGAGNTPTIVEIMWQARVDSGAQTPYTAVLEFSDDAATWTHAWDIGFTPFSNGQQQTAQEPTPPPAGAHRFWRLKWDSSLRGFCSAATLELHSVAGGPDITQGATGQAIADSAYGGYPASNAFDNNITTFWSNAANAGWVGWDFGINHYAKVVEMRYSPRDDGAADQDGPRTGGIEYSDDGTTWTRTADIVAPAQYVAGEYYTFSGPAGVNMDASEARTFSVVSSIAAGILAAEARTFAVYNFPSEAVTASQARTNVVVKRASAIEVSETRVFAVVRGRVADPRVRAWTCTIDGHDFYILRLGDKETLVYDPSTEQWVQWDSAQSGAWRPNIGTTWVGAQRLGYKYGTNVVAGDDTFGLLWFLNPYAAFDDAPDPLRQVQQIAYDRIVSGQALANARQQIPCYAVFLNGDNYGLTAIDFVPGITLEISDDQGRTFDAFDTLTMANNEDQQPDTWYSLGQFGSPGRIFRFRDNGIYARIDSAEFNDAG